MKKHFAVAIDGPSGAGKSTLAKRAAQRFGFVYVDTGAIYRTVGLFVFQEGIDPGDKEAVKECLSKIKLQLCYDERGQRMILNGEDVSERIREPQISMYASAVSAHGCVRDFLLDMQRKLAEDYDVVMDGRDIGTVVLPNASLKVFLTATSEDRARRRYEQLCEKGIGCTFEETLRDLKQRDENDSRRSLAPLKAADDAIVLDTTGDTESESFDKLEKLILERLKK